ncbi:MAG: LptF/LptG family permease [Verrucomicrobiota bacterium]
MKILDRYIIRQLCLTTFGAVSVLSVVLVLGNLFRQIFELLVNGSATYEFILTFLAYILPFSLTFTLPWGFLTAVLLVFGRLSAEHELTALKASGVSMLRLSMGAFGVALACVALCLWINVDIAPRAQARFKLALYELAVNRPLAMFESDRVIDEFPGLKIYVERNDGTQLHNLLVFEVGRDFEPQKVIFARRGKIHTDTVNRRLLLDLEDARFEQRDSAQPQSLTRIRQGITMQRSTLPISLAELFERNQKSRSNSSLTAGELWEVLKTRNAGDGSTASMTPRALSEARVELSKRFSLALASLALGLMAIPLAVTAQRRETTLGFLMSLIVAFAYFFMIIMTNWVKSQPEMHPEWLVWAPNVVFLTLGTVLMRRLAYR